LNSVADSSTGVPARDTSWRCSSSSRSSNLDPVEIREHPVEDDQIRLLPLDEGQRPAPGRRFVDLEALVAEGRGDGVDDRGFVVDDEDPPCRPAVLLRTHAPIVTAVPVSRL
jgi:hypothetical protein